MRSIRRSLLGYLLVLLALAFGAVGLFVDRFAKDAVRAREDAETKRITQAYDARRKDALKQFDDELTRDARIVASDVSSKFGNFLAFGRGSGPRFDPTRPPDAPRPPEFPGKAGDDDAKEYARRVAAMLMRPPFPDRWTTVLEAGTVFRALSPAWVAFEMPRALARPPLADALRKAIDEEERETPLSGTGLYQFTLIAAYPNRGWQPISTQRPARQSLDIVSDLTPLEKPTVEYLHDDFEVPGKGLYRRVVTAYGTRGRYLGFPVALPSQSDVASSGPSQPGYPLPIFPPPSQRFGGGPPRRQADVWVRLITHYARPHSELDDRLAADATQRDSEIAHVQDETRFELAQLRARLGMISVGSFVALALGGLFIVARGLSPIQKLSVAVSQVSEKDFRLPVERGELSHELAPIHARLTQTLDQLRLAFAREKEAVADISHELRTPIASLLATIDVALRKPRTPEQYRLALDECRGITRQLGQLVERIMTLANLDAGNARTTTARADAADVTESCAAVVRPIAANIGLTLTTDTEGPLELDTDPDKLREVLINLLHNAVEYNKPNGTIELTGRRENGRVVLEVRDTGIGMTPEVRARIFERFYRADASRTATGVHAGLGLAIVKEYVERLNGTIEVESEPGVGTTFRVAFPAAPDAPDEAVVVPGTRSSPIAASS